MEDDAITEKELLAIEAAAPTVASEKHPTNRIEWARDLVPRLSRLLRDSSTKLFAALEEVSRLAAESGKYREAFQKADESYAKERKRADALTEQVQAVRESLATYIDDVQKKSKLIEEQKTRIAALEKEVEEEKLSRELMEAHEAEVVEKCRAAEDEIRKEKIEAANRRVRNVKALLTVYHGCFENVTEKTRVVLTGALTKGVVHECPKGAFNSKEVTLKFDQPTHRANPAVYCKRCDVLYLGVDELPEEKNA